jgi:hypothetical protein
MASGQSDNTLLAERPSHSPADLMRQRWCAAVLLRAEGKFCRIKRYRHLQRSLKALDRLVLGKGLDESRTIE